ncbi:hypothetical protein [Haloferula sargassicola]|uniref:HEAT repeat domain-containing protein n=1 Tax=Haloferula sargassicola TaxID=490096 RepID=A0ABP9UTB1_9BACT
MKPRKTTLAALLLVAVALVGVGVRWKSSSRPGDASSEGKSGALAERAGRTHEPVHASSRSSARDLDRVLFRLLSISGSVREQGKFQLPKARDLQAALDEVPVDQLLAILENLDAREALSPPHEELIHCIFGALARHDPALALDTYWDRDHKSAKAMHFRVDFAFRSWIQKDPEAAVAWFEARRAKGHLTLTDAEKRIDATGELGGLLVQGIAAADPAKAAEVWSMMSEAQRSASLEGDWFSRWKPGQQQAAAAFLREHFDHDPEVLAKAASLRLRQGSLEDLGGFIDGLSPSSDERAALVGEAVRTRIEEGDELRIDPAAARAWILAQAPDQAAPLTGAALARMVRWHGFPEMADAARAHDATDPAQPTLVAFLMQAPEEQRAEILQRAADLSDPAARRKVEGRFGGAP